MNFVRFAAAVLVLGGVVAHAEILDYKFSGVNDELCLEFGGSACDPAILEFRIAAKPVPDAHDGTSFTFTSEAFQNGTIELVTNQVTGASSGPGDAVLVFTADGFLFEDTQFFTGPLFQGPTSSPTLETGTFDTSTYVPLESLVYDGPLVVTATPEPGSLALLGSGALGLVPTVRRRLWPSWVRSARRAGSRDRRLQ